MNDRTLKLVASIGVPVICLAVLVYYLTAGQTQPATSGPTSAAPTGPEAVTTAADEGAIGERADFPQESQAEAAGGAAILDAGDSRRVALSACSYAMSPAPVSSTSRYDSTFVKTRQEPGLVHANARIATLGKYGGVAVIGAIDADSADAKTPNVIRLDFTGKRDFREAVVLPLAGHQEEGWYQATFGPQNVVVRRGEVEIPVCVEGEYTRMEGAYRWCQLHLGTAIERTVTVGEQSYPVRFLDGNSDLDFEDAYTRSSRSSYAAYEVASFDTVIVGNADGTFDADSTRAYYGQPIAIGKAWYRLTLTDEQNSVKTVALDLKGGKLKLDAESWYAIVENDDYYFELNGGRVPIALPVGDYHLRYFMDRPSGNARARGPMLAVGSPYRRDGARPDPEVHIKADETFTLGVGAPLKACVEARKGRQDREIYLALGLTDAGGRRVSSLFNAKGEQPKAPAIKVFNADGKEVHSAKLEYG